jgi:polyisoprenoid-binding protein YceI
LTRLDEGPNSNQINYSWEVSMPVSRFALAAACFTLLTAPAALAQMPAPKVAADPKDAPAGLYVLDPHHASATVKLAHMGLSRYTMRFDTISGQYAYDPAHPSATRVSVAIDPRSIDTGDPKFNGEIADKFLDAGQYPTIAFTSTRIVAGPGRGGDVEGVLDFHGVRKPVVLHVDYRGFVTMMGQQRMGFSGETTFRRSDFGASAWVPVVGDEVTVLIEVEFAKQ